MRKKTDQIAILASNISFIYPEGSKALENIDFEVGAGEFVSLLASNGSGKTTLIKILTGILKAQVGSVLIDGKELGSFTNRDLYQRVGVVLQNPNDQLFGATVEDDVAFGPRNLNLSDQEIEARIEESLRFVSAEHLRKKAIHHLSYGEQKRVAIAGVLAMKPNIIILDEPTAGLDPSGETQMMRLLSRLNREQKITILLATHLIDMLPLFSNRIYLLKKGKLLLHGTPNEVFRNHELIAQANLRIPYISSLLHELEKYDGAPIGNLPLTVRDARQRLLELIPEEILLQKSKL